MLSRITSSSAGGISRRIAASTRSRHPRGLLDAGAGLGAHVQAESDRCRCRGRSSGPAAARAGTASEAHDQEDRDEQTAPLHQRREQVPVPAPEALEAALERLLRAHERVAARSLPVVGRLQQVHRQGRDQGAREHVGREHREDHRLRERARRGSAPPRPGRTSAGTRCRCRGSRPGRAPRSAAAPSRIAPRSSWPPSRGGARCSRS